MTIDRSRWPLCIAPVAMDLIDAGLTASLQPAEYWHSFTNANEASPLWALFLTRHPAAFAGAVVGYWAIVCACILFAPSKRIALIISLMVTFWHVAGAWSWLNNFGAAGYWGGVVALGVLAIVSVRLWEAAGFGTR